MTHTQQYRPVMRVTLPDDDIVRVYVIESDACRIQGIEQPGLAYGVYGAVFLLRDKECCCGQRRRVEDLCNVIEKAAFRWSISPCSGFQID